MEVSLVGTRRVITAFTGRTLIVTPPVAALEVIFSGAAFSERDSRKEITA